MIHGPYNVKFLILLLILTS
jgi:hypothetical protein